jgi:hypothetical protein
LNKTDEGEMCPFPSGLGKTVEGTLKDDEQTEREEGVSPRRRVLSLTNANIITTTTAQKLPMEDSAFAFSFGKPRDLMIRGK